ncbi:HEAT repeat domain-containing protein [Enterovibrio sp. ZSDZ35]|uniref:HEAT repeat domain-containing protein n=1 Tax=Enterovibrio qingdaonensis TaxID=2899818 RepID=A0ABT5QQW2_9GAMM|nr:HEAT repeat domain-containing protein [Enterovibrio sp. ZSDZ35]MDD1782671.1 HEAT repeat domain-containing protein [Enterovibrio sp. ZSDZ35]
MREMSDKIHGNAGYALTKRARDLLIDLLETGDDAQRCYSAKAVADASMFDATNALNECLYHDDPDVVSDAADALEVLKEGDRDYLIDVARHHPEGDCRLAALKALSHQVASKDVEKLFVEFAYGRQVDDQWGLTNGWDDWWDLQLFAVKCLSTNARSEYFALFTYVLTQDPEPELEAALYQGISGLNPDWIVDQLAKANLLTRRKLLNALKSSQSSIGNAFLFKHLSHKDALCRRIAVSGLAEKYATEYTWDIAERLSDLNPYVQQEAIDALERFGNQRALQKELLLDKFLDTYGETKGRLFKLLAREVLTETEIDDLLSHIDQEDVFAWLACTKYVDYSRLTPLQKTRVAERSSHFLQTNALKSHQQIQMLRSIHPLHAQIDILFPELERRILSQHQDSELPMFCSSVRQACFDLISHQCKGASQHLLKTTLFGKHAYPDAIDIVPLIEGKEDSSLKEVLDGYSVPSQEEMSRAPVSTIAAITQTSIATKLTSPKDNDDQKSNIIDMVDALDEEYQQYAKAVKDNFDSADALNFNRRKVAQLPEFDNKILAIRALGQSRHPNAVNWLIDTLQDSVPTEQREIFCSLAQQLRQCQTQCYVGTVLGIAKQVIERGDSLTQQSVLSYLHHVPFTSAIPLALDALNSEHEHVRLKALHVLDTHISETSVQWLQTMNFSLTQALDDPAAGVRKHALKLLASQRKLVVPMDIFVLTALNDEECMATALKSFMIHKDGVIEWISANFTTLTQQQQPNAIQLLGALL